MKPLGHAVAAIAARAPDRIAVQGPGESLTYAELDRMANQIASCLARAGVGPGARVGVHLPRSGRGIAAMLAALRLGAAYVPLDPGSPPARIRLIATDCGLSHVFVAPALLRAWIASCPTDPVEHFFLSEDSEHQDFSTSAEVHTWAAVANDVGSRAETVEAVSPAPSDLAYILYTSGSTGVPKGVMLSQENAISFVDWARGEIALQETDRVASVAPFHFDLSVFDVWATLTAGATLVIVDELTVVSGKAMLERITDQKINVWYSVPSALILMLETGGLETLGAPSLRVVYFAGEVFPMKQLRRAMRALPEARFFNLFGPTETNVCLAGEVKGVPDEDAAAIPIGHPSAGDRIWIRNPDGSDVAVGEVGELFVDGPTVMLGYWDGGRRTPCKKPYATGDLVSQRPDGEIMYHGRKDHMVKIHGYRVELGEVEAALNDHPGVSEAVAFAQDQRLVVVALATDSDVSVMSIKRHCAGKLPRYMIPSEVRLVAALPRTTSGKVDRVRVQTAAQANDTSPFQATALPKENR